MAMANLFDASRVARRAAWGFAKGFARGVAGGWRSPESRRALIEALEQRQLLSWTAYIDPIGPVIPMAETRVSGTPVVFTEASAGYSVDQNPGEEIDLVSFRIVGPGEAKVTPVLDGEGGAILAYDVSITGSTSATSFLVSDPDGVAKLRTVTVTGSLQVFNAPQSDLVSSMTVIGGGVGYLYLDDVYKDEAFLAPELEQPVVLIGTDPGIRALNVVLGEVRNMEFRALGAVRQLVAHGFAGVRDELGNASVMIDAQSLFRVQTTTAMSGSDISAADDIGFINSGMNIEDTRIEAGGNVTQVIGSRMQNSRLYAGMRGFSGNMPASVEDFENKDASIGGVHLWDSTLDGSGSTFNVSFFESAIAAWKIGVVVLQDVSATSGPEYGIAANSMASVSYLRPEAAAYGSEDIFLAPVTVTNLTRPDDPRLVTGVEGFELEIFTKDFTPPTYKETPVLRSVNGELEVELVMASTEATIDGVPFTFTAETYNGGFPGPTLRVKPGDILKLTLTNNLTEATNLHTHGLHVSPLGNSDNVFIDLQPGETTQYVYQIPADHPEGLYWYHPHLHGMTDDQVVMGLSGLIIVQGDGPTAPELEGLAEKYMSLRNVPLDPITHEINGNLGANEQLFMVNNQVMPSMSIAPGETQVWNIGNIGNEGWYDLAMVGPDGKQVPLQIIGIDGNPMTQVLTVDSFSLAPGNRISILVTGGVVGEYKLKTLGFNQGFTQWPERDLATLMVQGTPRKPTAPITTLTPKNNYYEDMRNLDYNQKLTQRFSEDFDTGIQFRINGKVYDMSRMDVTAILNTVDEWVLENTSFEWHPFHIHVNAFQVISINGVDVEYGALMDTVGIPPAVDGVPGRVVIRTRYTDFVGAYVFHCHILFHEDHGMMANIQVVQPGYTGGAHDGHVMEGAAAAGVVAEIEQAEGVVLSVVEEG